MADRFVAFPGMPAWVVGPVRRARRRFRWFDTTVRAAVRFDEVNGGRLAAAISYYAFLAVFPLLLLSFSVLGFVLADDAVLTLRVESFLRQNVPGLPVTAIAEARNTAGVIGVLGFFYAGTRWVDAVRSSVRAVWRRNQTPGNLLVRPFIDLLAMLGLGAALLTSVGLSIVLSSGAHWLLDAGGLEGRAIGDTTLSVLAFVVGLVVNVVAFVGFLAGLPRLRMSLRRVIGPALLGAVGLELLKTVGRVYIDRTESNPAYTVVAGTVGLLVFLQLFNQLLLYCAALTATAQRGGVVVDRSATGRAGDPNAGRIDQEPAPAARDATASQPDQGPTADREAPPTEAIGPGVVVGHSAAEDGRSRRDPDPTRGAAGALPQPARPDAATGAADRGHDRSGHVPAAGP